MGVKGVERVEDREVSVLLEEEMLLAALRHGYVLN